ncbi:putative 1-phosphatidylinositol-3-phosphate 5-kinase FAB1C isoform X2 [Andrographis paniculata]|nr:putative 1-phosphatidylinositol-3-phosphate 5-kinase FAB1C isoform X2 [Andrographis paniculata]
MCGSCIQGLAQFVGVESALMETNMAATSIKSCNLCFELSPLSKSGKVHPSDSPRQLSESPSPNISGERFGAHSQHECTRNSDVSVSNPSSPPSVHCSPTRSSRDEEEDASGHFFIAQGECLNSSFDVDSCSASADHEFCSSFMSVGSSLSNSPSRLDESIRAGHYVQVKEVGTERSQNDSPCDQEQAVLERPAKETCSADNTNNWSEHQHKHGNFPKLLDFERNGLIWLPPPPSDVHNEVEKSIFTYDDEDDEIGDSSLMFCPSSLDNVFLSKQEHFNSREVWKTMVEGHFRALVSQLFEGHGLIAAEGNCTENWLDIITALAWQAVNYIKPDRSKGSSMDPCDYLKIKCVASGQSSESSFIKGIVCTKNIKHKRMTSQYKNARLLLLGGALEHQRVSNKLSSFETLLQQENDHLKTIVSKIEAHRPNVLLVEKSVSSFALELLLEKEISLVLNVKRPLLERIAQCSGATIALSTDHISTTRLGYCELFHLEKFSEEHEPVNQFNKKPSKTLMFFEGCPRRLGCTIVLRGCNREELKKVKHVAQYAVFAAYHLLLETSFLADEGASLPMPAAKFPFVFTEKMVPEKSITIIPNSEVISHCKEEIQISDIEIIPTDRSLELGLQESLSEPGDDNYDHVTLTDKFRYRDVLSEACDENLASDLMLDEMKKTCASIETEIRAELDTNTVKFDNPESPSESMPSNDSRQSILVSFTSHHMVNGTSCERSRLLRLKFYGTSDKPLGRYLRDLFDRSFLCLSCKESAEAHVLCYTHQHGNLTINVRHLPTVKLPGEHDGKIWMWHRCLRCAHVEGVPPATQRVVMSNAAWGLSFGKFLELGFSNQATGNRVASCGHSLQRDCLRFYGFGSMVALFRYSPISVLSVHLPPSVLESSGPQEQRWIAKEALEVLRQAKALYDEISGMLEKFKLKTVTSKDDFSDSTKLHNHVLELIDTLSEKWRYYKDLLHSADEESQEQDHAALDIFEINHLRHSLLMDSQVWERRLYSLGSLIKRTSLPNATDLKDSDARGDIGSVVRNEPGFQEQCSPPRHRNNDGEYEIPENDGNVGSLCRHSSAASILPEHIDSAWSGADQAPPEADRRDGQEIDARRHSPTFRKLRAPARVYSFDSAQTLQERITRGLPPGSYRNMLRDPLSNLHRSCSQFSTYDADKLIGSSGSSLISSTPLVPEGARLIVSQNGQDDIALIVYDNEPTSVIAYALCSREYDDWVSDTPNGLERGSSVGFPDKMNSLASDLSAFTSFGSLDLSHVNFGSYSSEDTFPTKSFLAAEQGNTPHLRVSFDDESSCGGGGKTKFSVTCYFAKQFDDLQKRCCPSVMEFIHSLSRCKRWIAQGGKSNVYFAKSFDDRFIIKQLTKTELDSFEEFAPEYFKYLTEALSSGSPTCLAKILGVYQVNVKSMKSGGKEVRMDLMVMENLFFKRSISKVYDLKGSARSRYNSDTTGANKVLLDANLLQTLQKNPIFLGSKAKRRLERAIWNDTSFLAAVDVMDYSLLVGEDVERKELVVGIIDYMRQYTWDKQLETWVKASGILGGPKNASPTIVSPKQYKKRFRKAMTAYFLTVPDQLD